MFQRIGEKIIVAGTYKQAAFYPRKFLWNKQTFLVSEITVVTDIRDGMTKKRMYSLLCGKNLYRVVFNRDTETWVLEEIWME